MPALSDTAHLLLIAAVLATAGFVRGFSGFGANLIAMPVLSAFLGPQQAVVLTIVADFVLTLPLLPPAYRRCDWHTVLPAALATLVTVPLGVAILAHVAPTPLRWTLCIVVLLMLLLLISGWRYRGKPQAMVSVAAGAISGLFGGIAGIAGPPIVAYWLSGPGEKSAIRANLIAFFSFTSASAIVSFFFAGLLSAEILLMTLIAAPIFALTVWLGTRAHVIASDRQFRALAFSLIALAAIIGLPALDPILRGG